MNSTTKENYILYDCQDTYIYNYTTSYKYNIASCDGMFGIIFLPNSISYTNIIGYSKYYNMFRFNYI